MVCMLSYMGMRTELKDGVWEKVILKEQINKDTS